MEFNGPTLESLSLDLGADPTNANHPPLTLPRMQALTEVHLCIEQRFHGLPATQFFPEQFPALREFCIGEYRAEWRLFPKSLVIPTLKEFSLRSYIGNPEGETWHIAASQTWKDSKSTICQLQTFPLQSIP